MAVIELLGSTLGLAFVSGINLYATVLTIGISTRLGWVVLPEHLKGLAVLGHPVVLVVAGAIYTLGFVADKIPWVDTVWDSIHVFIRPFGAAALAVAASADTDPVFKTVVALICGAVALGSHSAKAGTRLVANHSPEPFSNIALSLVDDAVAFSGAWLAIRHPLVTLAIVCAAMAILVWFLPRLFRLILASVFALRGRVLRLVGSAGKSS